jgi:glucokinase
VQEHVHQPDIAPLVAGIELAEGATRIAVTLAMEPHGRRWQQRLPTPPTPDEAVEVIAGLIEAARSDTAEATAASSESAGAPGTVGLAVWGDVDSHAGVVRRLPPRGEWAQYPLARRLASRLGAREEPRVTVVSGAQAAALAAAQLGDGMVASSLLYVHLGRVVSSAYVSRGRILAGAHGAAAHLAHVAVQQEGPRCACGGRGHLDAIASAQAIVRTMIGRASDSDDSTAAMLRITGGRAEAMTAAQVVALAEAGDPAAHAVTAGAVSALACALAHAVTLLDPEVLVLDGVLAGSGSGFQAALQAELNRMCGPLSPAHLLHAAILPTSAAALLGARLVGEHGLASLG